MKLIRILPHLCRRAVLSRSRFVYSMLLLIILSAFGCRGNGLRVEQKGEMVMYSLTSRIPGFDPVRAGDVSSSRAISKIYEGLLQYSYLVRPYQLEPNLAASMPEVSTDGLTYTFRIRKNIFFQDDPCFVETGGKGRELTAQDFVYSIKRVADLKNESSGYWAFRDKIRGLDKFREASRGRNPTDYSIEVEGLQAEDRYTLRITLKHSYPQLLWVLAMHYAFAVPREAVEYYEDKFLNNPVGTGPYVLKNWRRNYRVEFVRNPKWKETGRVEKYPDEGEPGADKKGLLVDAGKPIPFIDRIVQYVIDDGSTAWLKFVTGDIESSGISRNNWDAVITQDRNLTGTLRKKGIRLYKSPTLDVFYIGFNMDDPVVGSSSDPATDARRRKLRQALTCAFNSETWIQFYNNRIIRAKGPIPPGVQGRLDEPSPFPFNLELAKKLLAEAGYPEGLDSDTGERLRLTIELGSAADPETRESVELLVDFFSEIGVILEASYNHWPEFLEKLNRRQCQLYRLGWIADYPDAQNFLQLFYGPNSSPGPNHSNYSSSKLDALYRKIATMPDSSERTRLYKEMSRIVVKDCPWIFMHHPMSYGLIHSWLKNYKPHDFPYGMEKYYRIDIEARTKWRHTYGQMHWRESARSE